MTVALTIVFAFVAFASRLVEHAPNVAALGALALWSGAYLTGRSRYMVPLGVALLTDIVLGFDNYWIVVAIYSCYMVMAYIGSRLEQERTVGNVAMATVGGSLLFFIVTNFAVWVAGNIYPHTVDGFIRCYVLAIPFFRNSLLGDAVFVSAFFGTTVLVTAAARLYRSAPLVDQSRL